MAMAGMLAMSQMAAHAQTAVAAPDYAAMVNGAKAELYPALSAIGPIVLGITGVLAAVGFGFRYFKRAAKSS
jgi:hypothetical protein